MAACGNQSSKSEDKKETSKSEETVEISFWHAMSGANEEAIQKITDDFMKENLRLKKQLAELQKENDFLKKAAAFFAKEID